MLEKLLPQLAKAVAAEFPGRPAGHCLRVDNLDTETAEQLCAHLRKHEPAGFSTYVLDRDIRADQAIEMRNRKETGLCLIVPADIGHVTASSLGNSFAAFDFGRFLHAVSEQFERGLPEDTQTLVRRVRSQLRGRASVSLEDLIGFYLQIKETPDPEAVGRELWRVGLIPDPTPNFVQRLSRNRKCVDAIARPARPQNSASERLAGLGLPDGKFKNRLAACLSRRVLHETEGWQKPIAFDPSLADLTFNLWPFPDQQVSELRSIEVQSFLDTNDTVLGYCRLNQPDGPGTSLRAQIGPKQKVAVRWKSDPPAPAGVRKWRVELMPSRREYGEEASGSLSCTICKNTNRPLKSANVSLDLEETEFRAVEIRIAALSEEGLEVQTTEGEPIYGFANEFWLTSEVEIEPPERLRKRTETSLPIARLRACLELKETPAELEESQAQWDEEDAPWYFSVLIQSRHLARIAVSPVAARLEDYVVENPRAAWPNAHIESDRVLRFEDVTWDALPGHLVDQKCWADFLRQRELMAKELSRRAPRSRLASVAWDGTLSDRTRRYARSYRDLLDTADAEALPWTLRLDTLQLTICYPGGRQQTAAVLLPLHPLRLLWYSAYADLLDHWRRELAKTANKRERAKRIELAAVERLAPLNLPMFSLGPGDHLHIFAQNLGLFLGAALPPDTKEPARALAEVASVLGIPSDFVTASGFPVDKLGKEIVEYRRLHPYADTLRVSISNPGDGFQTAVALQQLYKEPADDLAQRADFPKLDLIAHASEPLPLTLPGLDRLREQLYLTSTHQRASHLAPVVQVAIRSLDQLPNPPGGDINLALLIDETRPDLRCESALPEQDSASVYGLLTRIASEFRSTEAEARWIHQIALPIDSSREKHPVQSAYTSDLADTHRAVLGAVRRLLDPRADASPQPSLTVDLTYDDRNRLDLVHHSSDWVILLDRFLGIDIFDDPGDPYLATTARKYLLDYAPEFIEGLGHRLVVTTAWREEVEEILALAMKELGFSAVEESVGEALQALKSVSGRLALRMIHDNTRAREAASLGVVVAWLKATGELTNSVLLPVDAHPEIFSLGESRGRREDDDGQAGTFSRCDLVRIRARPNRLDISFIEVKSRTGMGGLTELADRMCGQMEATERRFRELFFSPGTRVDHIVQRSKLAAVLRFYARRASRYGFFENPDAARDTLRILGKLEGGIPQMKSSYCGFIVDLSGSARKPFAQRGASFRVLTARDFESATVFRTTLAPEPGEVMPPPGEPAPSPAPSPRPAPPQPATPPTEASGDRPIELAVPLGVSLDEEVVTWKASVKGSPHLFIIGIPGQGKSWTVMRLLCDTAHQGLPAVIIDFHGQFGAPGSAYYQLAQPSVWDATEGLPFSPFEAVRHHGGGTSYWKTNCFAMAEILQYVFGLGDIQRGLIYDAMRDCYLEMGFEGETQPPLPKLADLERKIRQYEERRGVRNVLVRCHPIFDFQLFREGVEAGNTDFLRASARGLVIDLHRHPLEQLQMAAGAFVLRKIYKDMFAWGETDRLRVAIVLDEVHRISRDTRIMHKIPLSSHGLVRLMPVTAG